MLLAANSSKASCHIGFNYRFLGIFQIIKRLLDEGEFGKVITVDLEFKRSSALTRKNHTWRDSAATEATSGALGDLGSHLLDMLYHLFYSDIDFASCMTKIATHVKEKEGIAVNVDDYALISGRLMNGLHFRMLASKIAPIEEVGLNIRVVGIKKELRYSSQMKDKYLVRTNVIWNEHTIPTIEGIIDPPFEVYGWLSSLIAQLESWTNHINTDAVTVGATFADGFRGQRALAEFLDKKMGEAMKIKENDFLPIKLIEGVIFDFNGVLLLDGEIQESVWNNMALKFRKTTLTDYDKAESIHGKTTQKIFECLLNRSLLEEEIPLMIKEKEEAYREECRRRKEANDFFLSPGAVELLDFLKENNIARTIATSSSYEDLKFFIESLNLDKWFEASQLIYNDGSFPSKPHPAIFLKAADAIKIPPEKCLVFEDASSGILSAINANIGTVYGVGNNIDKNLLRKISGVVQTLAEVRREIFSNKKDDL